MGYPGVHAPDTFTSCSYILILIKQNQCCLFPQRRPYVDTTNTRNCLVISGVRDIDGGGRETSSTGRKDPVDPMDGSSPAQPSPAQPSPVLRLPLPIPPESHVQA